MDSPRDGGRPFPSTPPAKLALFAFALVSLSICLWVYRSREMTTLNAVLALVTLWVALAPAAIYVSRRDLTPMPFLPLLGLYYAVFFAASCFFFYRLPGFFEYGIVIRDINVEAQILVLAGLLLMFASYYVVWRHAARRLPYFRLPAEYSLTRFRFLIWLLLAVDFLWRFIPDLRVIPSIGQFIQPAGFMAVAVLVFLSLRKELSAAETALLYMGVLPVLVLDGIASGLLTGLVLLSAYIMVLMMYAHARMAWLVGGITLVIVLALYPGMTAFRTVTWSDDGAAKGTVEKVWLLIDRAAHAWQRTRYFHISTKGPLIRRLSGYILMSRVVTQTPSEIPYWKGETYRPIMTSFIPRAIWPGKPEERFGAAFGHRYRMLAPTDKWTSLNIPWVVEMYANFGRWGVLTGMTLVGALLAVLSGIFNRREMTAHEFAIGASIIFPLVYPSSNFSLMTGSLLPLAVALWVYFRLGLNLRIPWVGRGPRSG